jgi:hypothetical protein
MAEEVKTNTTNDQVHTETAPESKVYTQAEIEKLIEAETDRKVTLAKSRWDKETSKKLTEAEKLAKMSQEDQYKYQLEQKEAQLAAKEREFTLRDNKIAAMKVLSEKEIPADLVDFVVNEDAETMMDNINKLDKYIKTAVANQIKARLASPTPKVGSGINKEYTKESFSKLSLSQQQQLANSNPELYKELTSK